MSHIQENISDISELSEESKCLWDKMLVFKQRFKDYESRAKSLEGNLAKVNLDLSLVKKENSRLNEKLEEQRSSINKYQQILKDLVEVEDRYCKLLVEKKKTEEELSSEKKLRLELQNKSISEKAELQKSVQNEVQILKEHATAKENILRNEYSKIIEDQKVEIKSLLHQVSEARKEQEEQVSKAKHDMVKAQREISRLKGRPCGQEKLMIVNNVTLKPIIQEGSTGTRMQAGEDTGGVEMTTSKSQEYIFEQDQPSEECQDPRVYRTNQLEMLCPTSSRRSILAKEHGSSHPRTPLVQSEGTFIATSKQHDSEPFEGRRCNSLEVFRIPSRIRKKSPSKKRKLYSRSDDTV